MDKDTSKPKKSLVKKLATSPLSKDIKKIAKGAGEMLGLYPENEPAKATPIRKYHQSCNLGTGDCDIQEPHKHVSNRIPYDSHTEAELDRSVSRHPGNGRSEHFSHGSSEHMGLFKKRSTPRDISQVMAQPSYPDSNVVSLSAYRASKKSRKPSGY